MQVRQGSCFRYAVPAGWRASDSTNGVDILSPDRTEYVFLSVFERGRGHQTPEGFVRLFASLGHATNVQVISDVPGPPKPWFPQTRLMETRYLCNGIPMRSKVLAGAVNSWGQWSAFCQGYCAPAAVFANASPYLEMVARTITPTGGARIAGANTIMTGINHPNTAGNTIMNGWNYRNGIYAQIDQARTEEITGYTRQKDPALGTIYDMPNGAYDPTRGGFVNPLRPTELLQHAQPGE